MHYLFFHLVGNTSYFDVTELAKIAVSLHCDTCSAFSTHSPQATVVTNIKLAIQTVRKDPRQNLVGCFAEFEIGSEFYTIFKGKLDSQYHDKHDRELGQCP